MGPTSHLTWDCGDPSYGRSLILNLFFLYYTTPHIPHLAGHTVQKIYIIHFRYLVRKMPNQTYRCGNDEQTQMHKEGRWPPTPQGLLNAKPQSYKLYAQSVKVAPIGWYGKLCHLPRGDWSSAGTFQQPPEFWLHLRKNQYQEAPDIIYTFTHIGRLYTRTYLRLALDMVLQGRDRTINQLSLSTEFTGTNNQEGPTAFTLNPLIPTSNYAQNITLWVLGKMWT